MEPFYIRQTAQRMTAKQRNAWVQRCILEAEAHGALLCRFSSHPHDKDILLVEAWKQCVEDKGQPRWQLQ